MDDNDGYFPEDDETNLLTEGSQSLAASCSGESSSRDVNLIAVPEVDAAENVPDDSDDNSTDDEDEFNTAQKENEANNLNVSKKKVKNCYKKKETGTNNDCLVQFQRLGHQNNKNIRVRNHVRSTDNNNSGLNEHPSSLWNTDFLVEPVMEDWAFSQSNVNFSLEPNLNFSLESNEDLAAESKGKPTVKAKPLPVGNLLIEAPGVEIKSLHDLNRRILGFSNQMTFKVPKGPPPSTKSTKSKGSTSLQTASRPSSMTASSRSAYSAPRSKVSTGIPYCIELESTTSTSLPTASRPTSAAACSRSGNSASTSHSTFGAGSPSLQKVSRPSSKSASSRSANSATKPYWNELKLGTSYGRESTSSKGSTYLQTASRPSSTVTPFRSDNSTLTPHICGAGNQRPPLSVQTVRRPSSTGTSCRSDNIALTSQLTRGARNRLLPPFVQAVLRPSSTGTFYRSDNSASTSHSTSGAGYRLPPPSVQAVSQPSSTVTSFRSDNIDWDLHAKDPTRDPFLNEVALEISNGGSVAGQVFLLSPFNTDELVEQYMNECPLFEFGLKENSSSDLE